MKATNFTTIRETSLFNKTSKKQGNKIKKNSIEKKERKKTIEVLKNLVGTSNDCSQLEVMQAVIDYIASLKKQLTKDYDETNNVMETEASNLAKALASSFN
ncbi:Myc-type, basic helix-loop-helix (bHLH) domain-containing protein [Strongyloides ratti]|uniref:Myc-type, basic helix-loop-helix (BHLH) domain-containing protein n=1 Tax=Strongyloides ratti TaxID=34506 RepID=A0A090KTZ0_STRRB|nr:Myc-type, basic helix-loop-helix (bHLH) domain-containing protein [Strongyloides ratti]CEF59325.1 Myc-type, basic helix-loop-helix (bHLH) domain-containing protein [Strongyloides ratti]